MTNDSYKKGFWPPEAKVAVDSGYVLYGIINECISPRNAYHEALAGDTFYTSTFMEFARLSFFPQTPS
jgi:hypothetical protein